MTTALDLITLALKDAGTLGVGQTPLPEDTNDAFTTLNGMLSLWQKKRWLVYHLVELTKTATGAQSYTVGPGGDFSITYRPDEIDYAFVRQLVPSVPNQVDYSVRILNSREDYSRITLKSMGPFPQAVWYDAAFPLGNLYFWPLPSTAYEMHIGVKEALQSFTNLTDSVNLPPEYVEAIRWNLGARLRPMYQLDPDPTITALAQASLDTIRSVNAQIPLLRMPSGLRNRNRYNIYSDGM